MTDKEKIRELMDVLEEAMTYVHHFASQVAAEGSHSEKEAWECLRRAIDVQAKIRVSKKGRDK